MHAPGEPMDLSFRASRPPSSSPRPLCPLRSFFAVNLRVFDDYSGIRGVEAAEERERGRRDHIFAGNTHCAKFINRRRRTLRITFSFAQTAVQNLFAHRKWGVAETIWVRWNFGEFFRASFVSARRQLFRIRKRAIIPTYFQRRDAIIDSRANKSRGESSRDDSRW